MPTMSGIMMNAMREMSGRRTSIHARTSGTSGAVGYRGTPVLGTPVLGTPVLATLATPENTIHAQTHETHETSATNVPTKRQKKLRETRYPRGPGHGMPL